jgi:hypothetical protein
MRASDAKYHSPFSYAAIQAGYVYLGGKVCRGLQDTIAKAMQQCVHLLTATASLCQL